MTAAELRRAYSELHELRLALASDIHEAVQRVIDRFADEMGMRTGAFVLKYDGPIMPLRFEVLPEIKPLEHGR